MPCHQHHAKILNEDELSSLMDHQMHKHGRHKSVHQAFALGYSHGIRDFIHQ